MSGLTPSPLDIPALNRNPVAQFRSWFDAWIAMAPVDPNAMVIATVDTRSQPWARTVLLKRVGDDGFVFFTNRSSHKGGQIAQNARAALHFMWLSRDAEKPSRQIQVQGRVVVTDAAEDDAYFASRPRESQLGAWASLQSRPLADRDELENRFAALAREHEGRDVPRPPHWGGYRVVPERIEFWQAGAHRLHDRFEYVLDNGVWRIVRLNP